MKNLSALALLFVVCSLLASTAFCQSSITPAPRDLPGSVVAARCQYATTDNDCAMQTQSAQSSDSGKIISQMPRRLPPMGPRRPPRPMMAYPMPQPSLRHAAIGGLIGFVIGVSRPNIASKDRVGLGLVVGAVGAAIGAAIPSFHSRYSNPRGPWPDDEDEEMGSKQRLAPPATQRQADDVVLLQTAQPSRKTALQASTGLSARATP